MKLKVWVPGPLANPMNGTRGHWGKHARWAQQWRQRTEQRLLLEKLTGRDTRWREIDPELPKRVTFTAHTVRRWDDDNLRAGMKPIRDGVVSAHLIDSDALDSGHEFVYQQRIKPDERGVLITVELLNNPSNAVQGQGLP